MDRTAVSGTAGTGSIPVGGAKNYENTLLASDKSSGLCPCGTSRKVFSSFFRMLLPAELAAQEVFTSLNDRN